MSTIEDVRRENARLLAREAGGQSRFASRMDMSRQQANHLIGKTPVKNIGSELARKIESAFGRPIGWMDEHHPGSVNTGASVTIPSMDRASLSSTLLAAAGQPAVSEIGASREWLRQHIGARPAESLAIATVAGDSMRDTLPDGTMVLVDRSASALREDGIYMLTRKDDKARTAWFRRVHKSLEGGWRLTAEAPGIEPMSVSSATPDALLVLGRVVVALEVKRL